MKRVELIFAFFLIGLVVSESIPLTIKTFDDWKMATPTGKGRFVRDVCRRFEPDGLEEKIRFRYRAISFIDAMAESNGDEAIKPIVVKWLSGGFD